MSTLKADAIEAATGINTDLDLSGKGTGLPDIATGFKVGGTAGVPVNNLRVGTDGELITWDASGDPATVAVGTATHILTSNGAGAAPTFQAAAGGGKVLQVVQTESAATGTTTSSTFATTGISVDITPASTSNKVLVMATTNMNYAGGTDFGALTIFRGTVAGTNLGGTNGFQALRNSTAQTYYNQGMSIQYLDSPSTSSSQTYTLALRSADNSTSVGINGGVGDSVLIAMEIDGT